MSQPTPTHPDATDPSGLPQGPAGFTAGWDCTALTSTADRQFANFADAAHYLAGVAETFHDENNDSARADQDLDLAGLRADLDFASSYWDPIHRALAGATAPRLRYSHGGFTFRITPTDELE